MVAWIKEFPDPVLRPWWVPLNVHSRWETGERNIATFATTPADTAVRDAELVDMQQLNNLQDVIQGGNYDFGCITNIDESSIETSGLTPIDDIALASAIYKMSQPEQTSQVHSLSPLDHIPGSVHWQ